MSWRFRPLLPEKFSKKSENQYVIFLWSSTLKNPFFQKGEKWTPSTLRTLRLWETHSSLATLDSVSIKNFKQLFSESVEITIKKVTSLADIISVGNDTFFRWLSLSRNDKESKGNIRCTYISIQWHLSAHVKKVVYSFLYRPRCYFVASFVASLLVKFQYYVTRNHRNARG